MDETITIPWWAVLFFTGIVLPWMLYLTRQDNIKSQTMAIMNTVQENMEQDLKDIRGDLKDMREDFADRMDKMEGKVDQIYNILYNNRRNS